MRPSNELRQLLKKIDRRGYPAYKDIKGQYSFPSYVLSIDHVQGDPFAAPSDLSVRVPGIRACIPGEIYGREYTRIAAQDHLTRLFGKAAGERSYKVRG